MGKFGFGKKSDGDEDSSRSSLFSRKSNKSSSHDENPYAQQPAAADPYGVPNKSYSPAPSRSGGLPSGPRAGGGPGTPSGYGTPPPAYSTAQDQTGPGGYGRANLGAAASGYGGNRYDSNPSPGPQQTARSGVRGPGGYGGLGESPYDEAARNDLFGGAQQRVAAHQEQPRNGAGNQGYGQSGAAGGSYGGYGETRELTEEEQEEAGIQADKDEINAIRGQSVATLDRSLQAGQSALDSMHSTMNRLASQQQRLANTEKKLDYAAISNRIAEEKTTELRRLNRSMFVPAGLSKKQEEKLLRKRMEDHVNDRETRQETRKDAYLGAQRMEQGMKQVGRPQQLGLKSSAAERNKYVFEDDDGEQNAMEDQIDDKMEQLGSMVSQMGVGARLIGTEVDSQNKMLDRIAGKTDVVDDGIRYNREKLGQIR